MKCYTWSRPGYQIVAMDQVCGFSFESTPELVEETLDLRGGALRPGCRVRGMFGPLTSAQYMFFHPIAPGNVQYLGVYSDSVYEIALGTWDGKPGHDGRPFYYGWILPRCEGYLFTFLRSSGTVRTVQTDHLYLDDDYPPAECIHNEGYWRKK